MRVFGFSAVAGRQKSQIVFALVVALSVSLKSQVYTGRADQLGERASARQIKPAL